MVKKFTARNWETDSGWWNKIWGYKIVWSEIGSYGIAEFRDEKIRTYIHRWKGCAGLSLSAYANMTVQSSICIPWTLLKKIIPRSVADRKSFVQAFWICNSRLNLLRLPLPHATRDAFVRSLFFSPVLAFSCLTSPLLFFLCLFFFYFIRIQTCDRRQISQHRCRQFYTRAHNLSRVSVPTVANAARQRAPYLYGDAGIFTKLFENSRRQTVSRLKRLLLAREVHACSFNT